MAANLSVPGRPPRAGELEPGRHHVEWAVQARTTVHDAKRYTRFVGIMKRALLVAVAALLLAVVAYSLQPRDTNQYKITVERMGYLANDLAMVKPRLTGADSDGNPFVVTAEKAIQDAHNVHRARLANVQADLTARDGAWYDMSAPTGFLDSDAQKLWLNGKVALFSDSGYELHTDAAFVDLAPPCDPKTGKASIGKGGKPRARCARTTVRGDHVVTGQGPLGTLKADRFHIEKLSRHVFLDGHVRMVLYPQHGAANSKTSKT